MTIDSSDKNCFHHSRKFWRAAALDRVGGAVGEFRSLLASPGILRCAAGKLKLGITVLKKITVFIRNCFCYCHYCFFNLRSLDFGTAPLPTIL